MEVKKRQPRKPITRAYQFHPQFTMQKSIEKDWNEKIMCNCDETPEASHTVSNPKTIKDFISAHYISKQSLKDDLGKMKINKYQFMKGLYIEAYNQALRNLKEKYNL